MIIGLLASAFKAFIIALVLTPIVRDIFRSYNVVDRPGRRKVHAHPIPRVGGVPIAVAYTFALISFSDFSQSLPGYDSPAWKILPGVVVIFFTGLIDDFFTLRPGYKLLGQIAAAMIVFFNGLRIEMIADVSMPLAVSFPLTVGWLLLATNALNLIDGLDGLCAGMGLFATLTLFTAALIQGNYPLAHATLPLAGALLGFLCYNFNPATVFLGDSGALMVGFLLGCYGMIWTHKTATLLGLMVPLLAISIPLMDVSLSVLRRFLSNKPIFTADRGHIHHRLLDRGFSPRRSVLILYLGAVVAAAVALLISYPLLGNFHGLVILVLCGFTWAAVRQLRYSEFDVAGRLLFRGEFQRTLDLKVRTEQLATALQRAVTEADWWEILVAAGRQAGWVRLSWVGRHPFREQVFVEQTTPAWQFNIALAENESIQVEGSLESGSEPVDLLSLAAAISSSGGHRRHYEQPALS